jgi:hypothetical protein
MRDEPKAAVKEPKQRLIGLIKKVLVFTDSRTVAMEVGTR